jgi:hypothetical protein
MTELDKVLAQLREMIDKYPPFLSQRRALHTAVDDVLHEALMVDRERQPVYAQAIHQLRYMDAAGEWQTMVGLPGHIDLAVDQLRDLAKLLMAGGAHEVHLERMVPWHMVQSWDDHVVDAEIVDGEVDEPSGEDPPWGPVGNIDDDADADD